MKVLITAAYILHEKDILIGKKIKFSINDDKIKYEILIDKSRKIYRNEKYLITIIEIKPNYLLKEISFFDIDDRIFENPTEFFEYEQIFILQYNNNIVKFSDGIIRDIVEYKNNMIKYVSSTGLGSGGAPLINSTNFKVFGIHEIKDNHYPLLYGYSLKKSIKLFYEKNGLVNFNIKKENIKEMNNKIKINSNNISELTRKSYALKFWLGGISLKIMLDLIEKMKRQICKIEISDGRYGTGFFCNIQYDPYMTLKVLITANHILNENDILIGKKIKFYINNIYYEILIDESRMIYKNKNYDVTIIEIKPYDLLKEISFFNIDYTFFEEKKIFLLYYTDKMKFSYGIIKHKDNYKFIHYCLNEIGSDGGPLINDNFKVIGIHIGYRFYYSGTLLKEPIEDLREKLIKK